MYNKMVDLRISPYKCVSYIMQWCPLLAGVGTTRWQVYHHIKQVIIFLSWTVMTISLQNLIFERK